MTPFGKAPNLRLLRSEQIVFHEHPERKRTLRLVERIGNEKLLRNPPIVADIGQDSYVLLDGANRTSALQELGLSHIPVQIINYGSKAVKLKGWHHLLLEGRSLALKSVYEGLPGVKVRMISNAELEHCLELRQVFAVLVDETAACWGLFPQTDTAPFDVHAWMNVLERVVSSYEGKTRLERIKLVDYSNLPRVFETIDHQLILFPVLTKVELLGLVSEGLRIPTGLTRHLIPGRALGLNLALDYLTEQHTEEEKIRHFENFMDQLEVEGRIRYYEEPAFIMNE